MGNDLRHIVAVGATCLCCLAAALSATLATAGPNRWTPIGPDGANVVALVMDPHTPTTAFAGTSGSGILKTVDGGATWATANGGLSTRIVLTLAIDPSAPTTLYAGTDAGVFKSTDAGQSWAAANVGLPGEPHVVINALAIDSGAPPNLYAATSSGVYKTTDGAAHWTSINAGIAGLTPRIIAIDPRSPSVIYVGVDDNVDYSSVGVVRSGDAGASWVRIDNTFSVVAIAIEPSSPSRVYLAFYDGFDGQSFVRSADGGATWTYIPAPQFAILSLAIDPSSPATLFAGSDFGAVFRTADAGDHWAPVTGSPLAPASITAFALAASAPGTVYAGSSTGIFRSQDSAQTWAHLSLGVRNVGVRMLVTDPAVPSTTYTAAANHVSKTTDGGVHWTDTTVGFPTESVSLLAIDPTVPSTLYAVGLSKLYKSVDSGRGWAPLTTGLSGFGSLAIAPSQHSTLYAADYGVSKSVDGGLSWARSSSGIGVVGGYDSALAVDPTNADIVYFAGPPTCCPYTDGKFFKSTDGAAHWRQVPIALPTGTRVSSLRIDPATPSTLYAAYNDGNTGIGGIFKSSDSGETWTGPQVLPPATWVFALAIDPHTPSQIYAATLGGVYRSSDAAASWTPFNAGLVSLYVYDLSIDRTGSLLRAATDVGLFEYRVSGSLVAATVPLVEYVHSGFGHYFITSRPDEITKLDNGTFVGWSRTGSEFNAFAAPSASSAPVCRFFSTAFGLRSSHFYTPFAAECATRRADPHWLLESADAFDIAVPAADGSCAVGFAPVYRLYNNGQGGAPNHRYTTDVIVRAQMIAQGWMPEGLGPDAVQMCSPP